jgi:multiple sugar transport system permease protein
MLALDRKVVSSALKKINIRRASFFILLSALAVVWAVPLFWMVSTSLKHEWDILKPEVEWIPKPPTLRNYLNLMDPHGRAVNVFRAFFNSVFVSSVGTVLTLTVSSCTAYAFARMKFPGRDLVFIFILASMMVPGETILVPLFLIFHRLGWLDTYQALVLPGVASAFGVFLLRQFMLSIPYELEDAAFIDGANRLSIFLRIVLPLSKPALATLAIFTFLGHWNNFLWALIVINRTEMMTLPLALIQFRSAYGSMDYGTVLASVVVAVVPPLLIFIFAQDFIIRGMSRSGLKG